MSIPLEEWKAIVGQEDRYEISNKRRVRSIIKRKKWYPSKILKYNKRLSEDDFYYLLKKDSKMTYYKVSKMMEESWPEINGGAFFEKAFVRQELLDEDIYSVEMHKKELIKLITVSKFTLKEKGELEDQILIMQKWLNGLMPKIYKMINK